MAACLEAPPDQQQARIRELEERHPELRGELERRLLALRELGVLDAAGGPSALPLPDRFGDFEILEALGGGGMGVVYRARQISLGREVALKVIRPEQLFFPEARQRFQREIEAVSRLQHPGVIPIYAVGEEQGLPFFAMERVQGCTLAEALDALGGRAPESLHGADLAALVYDRAGEPLPSELPELFRGDWVGTALRLAVQLAEALAHCHARDILHRDVKPSNIALTVDGRAMLLDFGLTSFAGADAVTRGSSQIGTLFYMSPEQIRGERALDGRADLYSLGVTVYELLALQLPYQEETRPATEALILAGNPDPLRARNRRVPRDAEVVCLQAMALEPSRRYASAEALARDLRNVLELRPIAARPPGPLLRVRRAVQRRPGAATALALGTLLVVGTPTALYLQSRAHATELTDALDTAQERLTRFEEISLFLEDLFLVTDPDRADGASRTARELLDRGVARIHEDLSNQPMTRASLLGVMGTAYHKLGLYEEAREILTSSLELARDAEPGSPEVLAKTTLQLGTVTRKLEDLEQAKALLALSLDLTEAQHGERSPQAALVRLEVGKLHDRQRDYAAAESVLRRAAADVRAAPAAWRRTSAPQMAAVYAQLGAVLLNKVQYKASEDVPADLAEARSWMLQALEMLPEKGQGLLRATLLNGLGLTLKNLGELLQAEEYYLGALAEYRRLLPEDDDRAAAVLVNVSGLRMRQQRLEESLPPLEEAIAIFREKLAPNSSSLAISEGNRAGILYRLHRYQEAEDAYGSVIPLQEEAFGEENLYVAWSFHNLGDCQAQRGDLDAARESLHQSIGLLEKLQGTDYPDTAHPLRLLADVELRAGRRQEAVEALERALEKVRPHARFEELRDTLEARLAEARLATG